MSEFCAYDTPIEARTEGEAGDLRKVEEGMMQGFEVSYDDEQDVLYLARAGEEESVVEIAPGVNAELDASGELIGLEVFHASALLKDVAGSILKKVQAA